MTEGSTTAPLQPLPSSGMIISVLIFVLLFLLLASTRPVETVLMAMSAARKLPLITWPDYCKKLITEIESMGNLSQ